MNRDDVRAAGELAGEALAAGGRLVSDMHAGIAARPFSVLGSLAAPVRVLHDGISRAVYGGVSGALKAAAGGGARLVARRAAPDAPRLAAGARGSLALAAVNGVYGDRLRELALDMEIRRKGEAVPPSREALAAAFPDATARLAVFVHGLCETDEAWRWRGGPTYGERLQEELGYMPIHIRYNTGRHISDNGRALARLLEELAGAWPTGVEEIVLVGHSMGGLVARSACHYGGGWTGAVRHVFCLGSPHLGADLEKGANVLAWALARLPETRGFANLLAARSAGIKDLRFGACVEEDWQGHDPDEFLRDRCCEVPFLPDANYYFVGATLRAGPLGTVLGDLLVRVPSASGRGRSRRIPFEVDNGCELPGLSHFDLLNHPAVYEQLRIWLTRAPSSSPPATPAPVA